MSDGYSCCADESIFVLKLDGSARRAKRGLMKWNQKSARLETGFSLIRIRLKLNPVVLLLCRRQSVASLGRKKFETSLKFS